jgi:PDGLE domain
MSVDQTGRTRGRRSPTRLLVGGLLLAFLLAGFVSGYASSAPDGLERVAGDQGFLESGRDSGFAGSPLADYAVRGIDDERLAGGLAGVLGVLMTVVVGTLLFWALSRFTRGRRAPADRE